MKQLTSQYSDTIQWQLCWLCIVCRYGGFSLGNIRPYVPEDFGKNAPSEFRRLAVRHVAKVKRFSSFLGIAYAELL